MMVNQLIALRHVFTHFKNVIGHTDILQPSADHLFRIFAVGNAVAADNPGQLVQRFRQKIWLQLQA